MKTTRIATGHYEVSALGTKLTIKKLAAREWVVLDGEQELNRYETKRAALKGIETGEVNVIIDDALSTKALHKTMSDMAPAPQMLSDKFMPQPGDGPTIVICKDEAEARQLSKDRMAKLDLSKYKDTDAAGDKIAEILEATPQAESALNDLGVVMPLGKGKVLIDPVPDGVYQEPSHQVCSSCGTCHDYDAAFCPDCGHQFSTDDLVHREVEYKDGAPVLPPCPEMRLTDYEGARIEGAKVNAMFACFVDTKEPGNSVEFTLTRPEPYPESEAGKALHEQVAKDMTETLGWLTRWTPWQIGCQGDGAELVMMPNQTMVAKPNGVVAGPKIPLIESLVSCDEVNSYQAIMGSSSGEAILTNNLVKSAFTKMVGTSPVSVTKCKHKSQIKVTFVGAAPDKLCLPCNQ